mgnify:CR=1 FL=1
MCTEWHQKMKWNEMIQWIKSRMNLQSLMCVIQKYVNNEHHHHRNKWLHHNNFFTLLLLLNDVVVFVFFFFQFCRLWSLFHRFLIFFFRFRWNVALKVEFIERNEKEKFKIKIFFQEKIKILWELGVLIAGLWEEGRKIIHFCLMPKSESSSNHQNKTL